MDNRPKEDNAKKKPYEKPEVRRVRLRPEEAVLGSCKAASSSTGPLASPCSATSCPTVGS